MMENQILECIEYYRIPDFSKESVVVDIGVNVGHFIKASSIKGSENIIGFEIAKDNFKIALNNCKDLKGIRLFNKAVWRGDKKEIVKYNTWEQEYQSLRVRPIGDLEAETISLDEIIEIYGNIDFLKVDCEGSEYPILYTCTLLKKIKQISLEVHMYDVEEDLVCVDFQERCNYKDLQQFLEHNNFIVEVIPTDTSRLYFMYAINTKYENIR